MLRLSHQIVSEKRSMIFNSVRRYCIHISSVVVSVKAMYSASVDDLETILCFLLDHMT